MASFLELTERTQNLLMRPAGESRKRFFDKLNALSPPLEAADKFKSAEPRVGRAFSFFRDDLREQALVLSERFMRLADSIPGMEGLNLALQTFEDELTNQNPDLVNFAWLVFTTHHPKGRLLSEATPRLEQREPEKVAPSAVSKSAAAKSAIASYNGGVLPADSEEYGLEWYREDPFANEHHEHWHIVYPGSGVPDGKGGRRMKDRHGELFFYMHQQMIARYDAERIAHKLPRVTPFADYREIIDIGYDPGELLTKPSGKRPFATVYDARQPNMLLRSISNSQATFTVADQEVRRQRVWQAIRNGQFETSNTKMPVTVDMLGLVIEAARGSITQIMPGETRTTSFYGSLHNNGHNLIASINNPTTEEENVPTGVMGDTATAIRDPFFYRWHKHIDDAYYAWQEMQPPYDFLDRPFVEIRKQYNRGVAYSSDILLSFVKDKPDGVTWQEYGNERFGGENWNRDLSLAEPQTGELLTTMSKRNLLLSDRVTSVKLEHLVHEPFVYFFRVENKLNRHYTVTARVFLAPKQYANDRRAWIEMDKFLYELKPLERAVITRLGSESSVIRKPAEMKPELFKGAGFKLTAESFAKLAKKNIPEEFLQTLKDGLKDKLFENSGDFRSALYELFGQEETENYIDLLINAAFFENEKPVAPFLPDGTIDPRWQDNYNYCRCGWAYNLLLPRGTEEGMDFRLMVVFTDWDLDKVGPESCCGSVSFCGALDQYPDKRPMGYPFDRPFNFPVTDTIMSNMNMAFRDIKIRWK